MTVLYFAYGSNMSWEQMRTRCASARFVCPAELRDHRLAFRRYSPKRKCGVADAVPEPGASVWGVVYDLAPPELALLDRHEGYLPGRERNGYTRELRAVQPCGGGHPIDAFVYFATPDEDVPPPSSEYLRLLVDGARHWGLPAAYVAEIERSGSILPRPT
jgi:hypothetical protein